MILISNSDFYFANYFQNIHVENICSQTIETKTFACFGFPFFWHLCIETDRRLANDNTNGARFIKQNVTRILYCTDLTHETLANYTMCARIIEFFFIRNVSRIFKSNVWYACIDLLCRSQTPWPCTAKYCMYLPGQSFRIS